MIQRISSLPENMVGFRAVGEITADDFDQIVLPAVKETVEKTGQLNYMLVIDTSLENFTAGAWIKDAILGIKNLTKWHRAAIVSDSAAIKKFTSVEQIADMVSFMISDSASTITGEAFSMTGGWGMGR